MAKIILIHHYSEFSEEKKTHWKSSWINLLWMFVIKWFQDLVIIRLHLIDEQYKDEYLMYIVYFYSNERNKRKLRRRRSSYSEDWESRLIKYWIKRSNIYPLMVVISFSKRLSWHNWRILRTNIGNWSIDDSKSIVNIKSINVRFSLSVNGSVLKDKKILFRT
jgi:hypothetical protein